MNGLTAAVTDAGAGHAGTEPVREEEPSAAILDALVSAAPVGLAFLDADLRYVRVNESLAVMNGLPAEEHVGRSVAEVVPSIWPAVEPVLRRVLESGEPVVGVELSGAPRPGGTITVLTNFFPVTPRGSGPRGIGVAVTDITEQRRAELNARFLTELDRRLAQLAEPDEMADSAVELLGRHLNASLCVLGELDLAGGSVEIRHDWHAAGGSLRGSYPLGSYFQPGLFARLEAGESVVIRDVRTDPLTAPRAASYADTGTLALCFAPHRTGGRPAAALCVSDRRPRDWRPDEQQLVREVIARLWPAIEQARAASARRRSEERFRQIAQSLQCVFYVTDVVERRVEYVSPAYSTAWGLDPEEVYRDHSAWLRRVHPDDLPRAETAYGLFLQDRAPFDVEYRVLLPGGAERWVRDRASVAARDAAGQPIRISGIAEDVTERRLADEERRRLNEQLQERVRELQTLLEILPVGVWQGDPECRQITGNRAAYEMVSLLPGANGSVTPGEGSPSPGFRCLRDGREIESNELPMQRASRSGQPIMGFEHDVLLEDGSLRAVMCNVAPVLDADGRVKQVIGAYTDITERKRAEQELSALARRLTTLVDNTPLAVVEWDADFVIRRWSGQAERVFGWTAEEVVGLQIDAFPLVYEEDRARVEGVMDRLRDPATPFVASTNRNRTRDGRVIACEWYNSVLHDESGRMVAVLSMVLDVTERQRTEQALRESEARYRMATDAVAGLVYDCDLRTGHVTRSGGLFNLVGYRVEEAENTSEWWNSLVHPDDAAEVARRFWEKAESGAPLHEAEYRVRHRDGSERWVWDRAVLVRDEAGRVARMVGCSLDITERKRAEAVLGRREARSRFMTELREQLDRETDPVDLLQSAVAALAGFLHVDFANVQEVDLHAETVTFHGLAGTGDFPARGSHPLSAIYSEETRARLSAGQVVAVADVRTDPLTASRAASFEASGCRACLGVPLMRGGRWVGAFVLGHGQPREWRDDVELVRAVAERVWLAHENARLLADLRRREEQLRVALAAGRMGTWVWDVSTNTVLTDPLHRELWGLDPARALVDAAEVFGKLYPDDLSRVYSSENIAELDGAMDLEFRIVRGDGRLRWLHASAVPIRDAAGRVTEVVGVNFDITDRKQAEDTLRESEALFRSLGEAVPDFLWMAGTDGRPIYQNPAWRTFTGLTPEELHQRGWSAYHHPDDLPALQQLWTAALAEGRAFSVETRLRRHDGEYRWFSGRTVPLKDEQGQVVKWVGTLTDIHDRKLAEAALRDADRRKDEFLATLAHELRNPLAPIRNAVQILNVHGPEDPVLQAARQTIDRQVRHMVRLIDDLLDVSRITLGKLELRWECVSLAAVVEQALETSRPHVERAGHTLTVSLPPQPVSLRADVVRLAQVFSNLLHNASKYTERGGHIQLTADAGEGEVRIRVADTGIGIPQEHLPRLFEMFTQVDPALDRSQGGLGIGLALVRGLVELHGGSVEARSAGPGQGSEFLVRLPLPAGPGEEEPGRPQGPGTASRGGLSVLVVDDNRDNAETLAELLRIRGDEVAIAHDGAEAVQVAERLRPDVVLLDIGMPKLDGYAACRLIREQPWGGRMFLIAQTGWGSLEDRKRAEEAGFDRHLVKPLDPAELMTLLEEIARGR